MLVLTVDTLTRQMLALPMSLLLAVAFVAALPSGETMNTYEVRTQDGAVMATMGTDDRVEVLDNLATMTLTATAVPEEGDALPLLAIQVDPLAVRPLVLVHLDDQGREVHREEVPTEGGPPLGVTDTQEAEPEQEPVGDLGVVEAGTSDG